MMTINAISDIVEILDYKQIKNLLKVSGNLQGTIKANKAYKEDIDELKIKFPNLNFNINKYYHLFQNKELLLYLLYKGLGDGEGITEEELANANLDNLLQNCPIKDISELNR